MTAGPNLAESLPAAAEGGRKAFVPYVTGGFPGVDAALLEQLAGVGADAIEVGIPFSDPVMDGPVIQEASQRALAAGASLERVLGVVAEAALDVPVAVMTYLNPVLARGEAEFLAALSNAGVTGAIIPDLPVDEAEGWIAACGGAGVAPVFLAAPNTAPDRLTDVAKASQGFVYCVSTFGVTGARESLAGSARPVVDALRSLTDTPLLVGVGISTPEQAVEADTFADGVVVGSALVRPLLEGDRAAMLGLAEAFGRAVHGR
ncbi:MAG TPA: tryptophan synthase subunit alpha [Actinomycetota bacterium]|nr:tryptophan synthase subunit alpha [Actinomycetota bacterium]